MRLDNCRQTEAFIFELLTNQKQEKKCTLAERNTPDVKKHLHYFLKIFFLKRRKSLSQQGRSCKTTLSWSLCLCNSSKVKESERERSSRSFNALFGSTIRVSSPLLCCCYRDITTNLTWFYSFYFAGIAIFCDKIIFFMLHF